MAQNERCPRCGAMLLSTENFCPQCGAPLNAQDAADETPWQPGAVPATIGQLRSFCDYNEMPLQKMRFFVGEDCREARAFGIYREDDQFVVYKNKADGSRAVRYHGPDEAHAVGELYAKLLDECHRRDIWPDGKPEGVEKAKKKSRRTFIIGIAVMIALFSAASFFAMRQNAKKHAHDGYYRYDDAGIYYRYGDDWYYDDYYYDWVLMDTLPFTDYDSYYYGADYDPEWGYSDFENSDTWEQIQEAEQSRTSSDDYSSWDSGDTDWGSDW